MLADQRFASRNLALRYDAYVNCLMNSVCAGSSRY